ncbi:GNAT family N-acetyltransferase [Clostridium sp.]|uniref:GNAT family N-acetyltransferase n=1 Tax=Clostridium sp. TaxID=1506 RepID=UPI003F3488AC
MIIRRENKDDYILIDELLKSIFKDSIKIDEINHLRTTTSYINELSLIAEDIEEITGYISFTKTFIKENDTLYPGVNISLLSVKERFQNQGVGKALIRQGLLLAHALGYSFVTTIYNEEYFKNFGFENLNVHNIKASKKYNNEILILDLKNNFLNNISGIIE